jgi:glucosylceramidase
VRSLVIRSTGLGSSVFLFTVLILPLFPCAAAGQQVQVIVSSKAGDRLAQKQELTFAKASINKPAPFRINDAVEFQKIDGFGASFLEAGLISINSLDSEGQEQVLQSLFDPDKGAGFSAMKTVIGSTDFQSAGPFYSYDDSPGDVTMKDFSLARDLGTNGLVTFIKRARRYGSFALQAPMDYPPDWMLFDVHKNQDVNPKYFDALAHYYLRYVQDYQKQGITIDYVSLFNEPGIYAKIRYDEIRDLLKNHVGPLFEREKVKTKLQLSEAPTRLDAYEHYPTILDDPVARTFVGGLAYHGYSDKDYDRLAELHTKYPELPLWMTEVCWAYYADSPKGINLPRYDWEDGDHWANMIFSDLEAFASAWIYWNMVLDEKGGPWAISLPHGNPDGNVQHPVVVINRTNKSVTYTALYYYLSHFSKFVRPGAVRVQTAGGQEGVRTMAFKRTDGKIVVEILNSRETDLHTALLWRDHSLELALPARSITTAIWTAALR